MKKYNQVIKEDESEQEDSFQSGSESDEQQLHNIISKNKPVLVTKKQPLRQQLQQSDDEKENFQQVLDYSSEDNEENTKQMSMKPKMKHLERPKTAYTKPKVQEIQKSVVQPVEIDRPTTANPFKAQYKLPMAESKIMNKQYDYKKKTFSTIRKKTDPVSRFQNLSQGWKKNKFLQNNNVGGQTKNQGRKLQISERIASSQPEYIFHKYLNKDQTKIVY